MVEQEDSPISKRMIKSCLGTYIKKHVHKNKDSDDELISYLCNYIFVFVQTRAL
jgi:hypothetical protein